MKEKLSIARSTWDFFLKVRLQYGISPIMDFMGVQQAQAYRYCENPDRVKDRNDKDPARRMIDLINFLIEDPQNLDLARSFVQLFADAVGCELACKADVCPDKETLEEECLDDYKALGRYVEAISERRSIQEVQALKGKAKAEIDETFAAYAASFVKKQ